LCLPCSSFSIAFVFAFWFSTGISAVMRLCDWALAVAARQHPSKLTLKNKPNSKLFFSAFFVALIFGFIWKKIRPY
jgi:uncharacterized membrane protein YjjB (DUF3815 family)